MEDQIRVEVSSPTDLREWLEANHSQEESIWLVTFKKHVKGKYVSTSEVLDELICFGWIDGRRMKLDENKTMQLISPRRVQHWAKTYKDRAAKLEREGKMTDAGRKCIADSKANGLWDFMDDVDALIQPEDLVKAFNKYPGSKECFENFGPASQRFALRWIKLAKKADTRAKRIEKTALLASKGEKVPGS
ncbi:MAG: YdeI/OmpD-associated family protein [Bacteroidota bacterium]